MSQGYAWFVVGIGIVLNVVMLLLETSGGGGSRLEQLHRRHNVGWLRNGQMHRARGGGTWRRCGRTTRATQLVRQILVYLGLLLHLVLGARQAGATCCTTQVGNTACCAGARVLLVLLLLLLLLVASRTACSCQLAAAGNTALLQRGDIIWRLEKKLLRGFCLFR